MLKIVEFWVNKRSKSGNGFQDWMYRKTSTVRKELGEANNDRPAESDGFVTGKSA